MLGMFERRRCHFHEGKHLIIAQIRRATLNPDQVPFLSLFAKVEFSNIGLVNLHTKGNLIIIRSSLFRKSLSRRPISRPFLFFSKEVLLKKKNEDLTQETET